MSFLLLKAPLSLKFLSYRDIAWRSEVEEFRDNFPSIFYVSQPHLSKMVHLFPSLLLSCIVSYVAAHGDGFAIQQSKGQINFHFGQPPVVERRNDDELTLRKRQSCGPSIGSCPKGQCCAASGLCGTGTQFCQGPQCLTDYSDSCDSL